MARGSKLEGMRNEMELDSVAESALNQIKEEAEVIFRRFVNGEITREQAADFIKNKADAQMQMVKPTE